MSQLSTNHRRIRRVQMHRPPPLHHASATRPSHPPLHLHSIHSAPPAEQQSATIGWCEVPDRRAWCPGARGARVWYGVKASQAQLNSPARDSPGAPCPAQPGSHHHARASQQGSRRASRSRPRRPRLPGSHCARTATARRTNRAPGSRLHCLVPASRPLARGASGRGAGTGRGCGVGAESPVRTVLPVELLS